MTQIQRPAHHPGFTPAEERVALMHDAAQMPDQAQTPPAREIIAHSHPSSKALWIGTILAVGVVGLGVGYQPWERDNAQPQTSGDTATNSDASQEALDAFTGTVKTSAEATPDTSPSASSVTGIDFKPVGTSEADIPILVA